MLKKFALPLCAAALLLSATFVPTIASASPVNYELASNPTAALAEIEKIGLPLSDQAAGEMRGEGYLINWSDWAFYAAHDVGVGAAIGTCIWITGGLCTAPVLAGLAYGAYRTFQEPIMEVVYLVYSR